MLFSLEETTEMEYLIASDPADRIQSSCGPPFTLLFTGP